MKKELDIFLEDILNEIGLRDKLHFKKINGNIEYIKRNHSTQFYELFGLIYKYFQNKNLSATNVVDSYLSMINDMRKEGLYFYKNGKYRCSNQSEAYEYVYSLPNVMTYYMHALLISQILWKHHFNIFIYFQSQIKELFKNKKELSILDIGPGHGFFSYIVKNEFKDFNAIDIVDISETSLNMTKEILGEENGKIQYNLQDIFDYNDTVKYDFIIIGEVIEHLDKPQEILKKISNLLTEDGMVWITTPTNSPAIDHVYLFNSKEEVYQLMNASNLEVIETCNYLSEDVTEEFATKHKITDLVGLFCKRK